MHLIVHLIVLTMRSANLIVHYELFTMGLVLIMKLIVGRVRGRGARVRQRAVSPILAVRWMEMLRQPSLLRTR